MLIAAPAVLREVCIRRLSLFVSGVLIPLACSVENSMLVSGVWSLAPQLRVCAARMRRGQAPYVERVRRASARRLQRGVGHDLLLRIMFGVVRRGYW